MKKKLQRLIDKKSKNLIGYLIKNSYDIDKENVLLIDEVILDENYSISSQELLLYAHRTKGMRSLELLTDKVVSNNSDNILFDYTFECCDYLSKDEFATMFKSLAEKKDNIQNTFKYLAYFKKEFVYDYSSIIYEYMLDIVEKISIEELEYFMKNIADSLDSTYFNYVHSIYVEKLMNEEDKFSYELDSLNNCKTYVENDKELLDNLYNQILNENIKEELILKFICDFNKIIDFEKLNKILHVLIININENVINTIIENVDVEKVNLDNQKSILEYSISKDDIDLIYNVSMWISNEVYTDDLRKKVENKIMESKNPQILSDYIIKNKNNRKEKLFDELCRLKDAKSIYHVACNIDDLSKDEKKKLRKSMSKTDDEFYILMYATCVDIKVISDKYGSIKEFIDRTNIDINEENKSLKFKNNNIKKLTLKKK